MFKFFLPLFAASLLLFANSALGQENSQDKQLEGEYFKIDFPGGPLEEYVRLVRKTASANKDFYKSVNIMIAGPTPFVTPLPSIQVTTNLDGALECLAACSTEDVAIVIDYSADGEINIIRTTNLRPGNESYRADTVKVFNLTRILVDVPKENVVTAIDIGLEISGKANSTEIKLHEETGLLFARGPEDQLDIIRQVVSELSSTNNANNQVQPGPYNPIGGTYYAPGQPNQIQFNPSHGTNGDLLDGGQQNQNIPVPAPTHYPNNNQPPSFNTNQNPLIIPPATSQTTNPLIIPPPTHETPVKKK